MRGLLKAACVLAPALASTLAVPGLVELESKVDGPVADHSFALIGVQSHADFTPEIFSIRLDVFPSEEACGFGNVTIDGQVLPQTSGEGKGSITTDQKRNMAASWSFHCIKVSEQPDAQLLKFVVNFIDGKAMEGVGFSALFRQTGLTEIINIETDLSRPDHMVANPNPEGLQPVGKDYAIPYFSIEHEKHELQWMRAQLKELEYLIWMKEQAIAEHASQYLEEKIKDCDSLKCVAKAVVDKARNTAHKVFNNLHGDHHHHDMDTEEVGHIVKVSGAKVPDHGKYKHGKPGNHTCRRPKPPHWKIPPPHHHPLPICRYPPPPHNPHHRRPIPPPPPHTDFSPDRSEMPPPPDGHHGDISVHMDMQARPKGGYGRLESDRTHLDDQARGGSPNHGSKQEATSYTFHNDEQGPTQPPHHLPLGKRPRHRGIGRAIHVLKFVGIGFLFAFLVAALHRRTCNSRRRVDRQTRREERHRRRALRRAAYKLALSQFIARISGRRVDDNSSDDYEEKQQALLASVAEDGMSTTMTEEITEFRNVAEVVEGMVAAESHRQTQSQPIPIPASEDRPVTRDYDIGSQVGDGEELPAYEDNDGSEMSSVVTDGFRYTPGSTEYSPSYSPAGSVNDILGPDTKQ